MVRSRPHILAGFVALIMLASGSASRATVPPALFGVVVNRNDMGLENLVIRAQPIDSADPAAYSKTDHRGVFEFQRLSGVHHSLDVIRDHTLLYRSSINLQEKRRLTIKLYQVP